LSIFAPSKYDQQMHSRILHTPKSIRFRRWSRAGYAVFCSLACSVTIGCVAISISDKSLQKSNNTAFIACSTVGTDSDSPEKIKAESELELTLQKIQEVTVSQMLVDNATACGHVTSYIFIHHSG
jgi:hypothetical protein